MPALNHLVKLDGLYVSDVVGSTVWMTESQACAQRYSPEDAREIASCVRSRILHTERHERVERAVVMRLRPGKALAAYRAEIAEAEARGEAKARGDVGAEVGRVAVHLHRLEELRATVGTLVAKNAGPSTAGERAQAWREMSTAFDAIHAETVEDPIAEAEKRGEERRTGARAC
jgi:hypothetical protein